MERINYAAGSVVTGDRLAHAIVAYARALARQGSSDTVSFPVLLESGELGSAEVLIGPASQVLNVSEPSDHDEVLDEELVSDLQRKTEALGTPRPDFEEAITQDDDGLDY